MEAFEWVLGSVQIVILGFLWTLHKDMSRLGERVAKLEGLFEGFIRTDRESTA